MKKWTGYAEYADGTYIERDFSYNANGNYEKECEEQYDIESWLIERRPGCTFYSVSYTGTCREDEEGVMVL